MIISLSILACQVIVLMVLTFKARLNAYSFAEGVSITHWIEWFIVASITFLSSLVILHWNKYFAGSLALTIGWASLYFNIILNIIRDKPLDYLGSGTGASIIDSLLSKVKPYYFLIQGIWCISFASIFYFLTK